MQILECPRVYDIPLLSAAVVPRQVKSRRLAADEDQLSVARERECRSAPSVAPDLLGDGNGIADQFEFLFIETLGHQIPAADEYQMPVGIFTAVVRASQGCILLRIECAQMNISPRSARRIADKLEEQKVPSVGQKCGPALRQGYRTCAGHGDVLRLTHCRRWGSASRRDAQQGRRGVRSEQDRALSSPGSTTSVGS